MPVAITLTPIASTSPSDASLITLVVASVVASIMTLISVEWSEYRWALSWTVRWTAFFRGLYIGSGAAVGALVVAFFVYWLGVAPEGDVEALFVGLGYGLAGGASLRADFSQLPQVGESLNAMRLIASFLNRGLHYEIASAVPGRLEHLQPAPLAQWVKRAAEGHYAVDEEIPGPQRKATIDRLNGYLSVLASAGSADDKANAVDNLLEDVKGWVPAYRLTRPRTRRRGP